MIDTASMDMDVKVSDKTLAMVVMIRTGAGFGADLNGE
jgi:hypothetical protein